MKRVILIVLAIMLYVAQAQAATLVESGIGGDASTGAITVTLSKTKSSEGVSTIITVNYATYDASGTLIRSGGTGIDYNNLTAAQKTAIDNIISKAIAVVKTTTNIP